MRMKSLDSGSGPDTTHRSAARRHTPADPARIHHERSPGHPMPASPPTCTPTRRTT